MIGDNSHTNLREEWQRKFIKIALKIPTWAVIKLAKYYNTTTDYILGLSDGRK